VDSIPTSGNKEDYVSMGMAAALKLKPILSNVASILAVELLTASHALDRLAPLKSGALAEKARHLVRQAAAPLREDRAHAPDIARVAEQVSSGKYARVLAVD